MQRVLGCGPGSQNRSIWQTQCQNIVSVISSLSLAHFEYQYRCSVWSKDRTFWINDKQTNKMRTRLGLMNKNGWNFVWCVLSCYCKPGPPAWQMCTHHCEGARVEETAFRGLPQIWWGNCLCPGGSITGVRHETSIFCHDVRIFNGFIRILLLEAIILIMSRERE